MTNKVVLKTVEEFMADYTPVYASLYPLFLGKSQAYSEEVGKINFNRLEAMGDIRGKHITPKDTEIRQIAVKEGAKTFKKYFIANQFTQSALQDQSRTEDVISQVLDEYQKHADDLFLLGEGTSASTMINNGLFWSNDTNYILESSAEIDTDADPLIGLHAAVITAKAKADLVSGRKVIIFYGTAMMPYYNGVYAASTQPFKSVLQGVLGAGYQLAEMPAAVTPSNTNGFIIANLDQCKLHYTILPQVKSQGVNDEKMYSWHNFMMGSMMLEVLASGAVIRQPLTFES